MLSVGFRKHNFQAFLRCMDKNDGKKHNLNFGLKIARGIRGHEWPYLFLEANFL